VAVVFGVVCVATVLFFPAAPAALAGVARSVAGKSLAPAAAKDPTVQFTPGLLPAQIGVINPQSHGPLSRQPATPFTPFRQPAARQIPQVGPYMTVANAPAATASAQAVNLYVPEASREKAVADAEKLKKVELSHEEYEWLHVLADGWAAPLKGFMTHKEYLQVLHWEQLMTEQGPVSMAVPITKSCTAEEKKELEGQESIAFTWKGKPIAVMKSPEFYEHRKEERAGRTFGIVDKGHPYIEKIYSSGDFLIGGEVQVLEKFKYDDGMDQWRLSPEELKAKFKEMDADAVFVFQLRNPVHNGHALLMQDTARKLKEKGYKKPVLWLSPLGGWTKDDDVPLDTRMKQHHAIIKNGIFGDTEVVLGIFPSPMLYAGPREVQWHAKGRLNAGATHYIVGRDPAGMSHPTTGDDLYDMWDGKTMLEMNTGLQGIELLPFTFASYDKKAGKMAFFDPARKEDFQSISGTKMRGMAASGESPPKGFMDEQGWQVLVKYYQSLQKPSAATSASFETEEKGTFPSEEYRMSFKADGKTVSPWHGIDTWADKDKGIVNAIIEISKNTRPKMEVATKEEGNPIKQDMKKGKLRDYPLDIFWNYGMIPKTWENPKAEHPELKAFGDNDPVDVVEIGTASIPRGSVVQVKAVGTLAMIDEGELDWKVIGVSTADPKAASINSVEDLDKAFPGQIDEIREWFRNYKSDGKFEGGKWTGITEGQNSFGFDDKCLGVAETKKVIEETQGEYDLLMNGKVEADGLSLK
jgi:3'-phosphoadenosine 5'-phosphosulfate synthase